MAQSKGETMILFINGSPEKNGNTARLAEILLDGQNYESLYLTDYRLNFYGQTLPGDQFDEIFEKIQNADILVIGSPMYWHNICGSVPVLLDRFYEPVEEGSLSGKLFFLFQGMAPEKWMLEAGEYTMKRFAALYGYDFMGMASNEEEAMALRNRL